jgi:hypothetical protein
MIQYFAQRPKKPLSAPDSSQNQSDFKREVSLELYLQHQLLISNT